MPDRRELKEGEEFYVAKVRLWLNYGKLEVEPGQVIVMGPEDEVQGVNVKLLLEHGGIEVFRSKAQVEGIHKQWVETDEPRRREMRDSRGRR